MADQIYSQSTYGQATRASTNVDSTLWVRNVSADSILLEPFQTPLEQWLHLNKNVKTIMVNHPQGLYEGTERELLPTAISLASETIGGAATGTFTVSAADANRFKKYQRIKFNVSPYETGRVTVVSGVTITVKRDLNSSNGAQSWSAQTPTKVYMLGESYGEKGYPTESIYIDPFFLSSRTQIFSDRVDYTERMFASTSHGGTYAGNLYQHRIDDMMKEFKIKKEKAYWENENHFVDTSDATAGAITVTQGVTWTVRNYGGVIGTYAGAHLTEGEFDTWLYSCRRGSKKKTLFAGGDLMADIEQIIKNRWGIREPISRYSVLEGDDTVKVVEYRVFNIILEIIWNPIWEGEMSRKGVLLDDNNVSRLQYVDDHKGSRDARMEIIVVADGAPFKSIKLVSDEGVYVNRPGSCGIIEPA